MRNILIPTDFSEASLQLVERTIDVLDDQQVSITLFHAFDMQNYAPDVLGSPRRVPYAHLLTDEFRNACKRIKDRNSKLVKGIFFKHMFGNTASVFRNFLDANDIDMIVAPDDFRWSPVSATSIDPTSLFAKSGIPVLKNLQRKRTVVHSAAPLAETVAVLIN